MELTAKSRLPLGVRNNNPGNIRYVKRDKWQGALPHVEGEPFVKFQAPQFGIRAIGKILISYEKWNINTVRGVIERWAPDTENPTEEYIARVAADLGVDPEEYIDLDSYAIAFPLVNSIIAHENSNYVYRPEVVREGLRMAGIKDAPAKALVKRLPFVNQATTGTVSLLAAGAMEAPKVKGFADQLGDYASSPIIANVVTFLVTAAGLMLLGGAVAEWLKSRKGL